VWRDVINEAEPGHGGHTTWSDLPSLRDDPFIASEVMFFVAWFWAYFNVAVPDRHPSGRARQLIGGVWPPKGIETFNPWHPPLVNTLIL
jgi:cytochrome c oxidase subunit 3